jgi:hypothetical protein
VAEGWNHAQVQGPVIDTRTPIPSFQVIISIWWQYSGFRDFPKYLQTNASSALQVTTAPTHDVSSTYSLLTLSPDAVQSCVGYWQLRYANQTQRPCQQIVIPSVLQTVGTDRQTAVFVTRSVNLNAVNPWTLESNPSTARCVTRYLPGILLLEPSISLIYAWKTNKYTNYSLSLLIIYLLHVSALNCHLQGAFLVPSERCSIEEQSIEYCGDGVRH